MPNMASTPFKLKAPLPRDLFSAQAEEAANRCSFNKDINKSSQIRRFYDELSMYSDLVKQLPADRQAERFREIEPYIQMLKAKAAYARGRKLIDENFEGLVRNLVDSIDSPESLENGKLFFEAFLGFRKGLE